MIKGGLNITEIIEFKSNGGRFKNYPQREKISNEQLLELPVEVLVPAALESVLTEDNAEKVRAKYIMELANGPTTLEADEIFESKGVIVVPDVLANAGGVTVSYFEWYQNMHSENWELERVQNELKIRMVKAFEEVWDIKTEKKVEMRTAAYISAINRLVKNKPSL